MNDFKTQLIRPDCGHLLVEIGYMANSYEGQPSIPNVHAWRTYACGCFMSIEEAAEAFNE